MAQPGWYLDPDPQAPPGRLRWWDGVRWSDATQLPPVRPFPVHPSAGVQQVHDPRQPQAGNDWQPQAGNGWQPTPVVPTGAGPTGAGPTGAGGPGRRLTGPLIGVLVGVLMFALLGSALWWRLSRLAPPPGGHPSAAPTVNPPHQSTSPPPSPVTTPSASSSGVRPSASGTPLPQIHCPTTAQPRAKHPADGRLHGGGLVVNLPRTFTPQPVVGLDFVGDQGNADRPLTANKVSAASALVVGSLDRTKFGSLQAAAESMIPCVYTIDRDNREPLLQQVFDNRATTLQGHPAWHLLENVSTINHQDAIIHDVEVVDLGGRQYGLYWSEALVADRTAVKLLAATRSTLTVGP